MSGDPILLQYYHTSVWLFNQYQFNHLQKKIRDYLLSDGKGCRKRHNEVAMILYE